MEEETEVPTVIGRATCVLYVGAARHPNFVVEQCSVPTKLAPGEVLLALKIAAVCPSLDLPPLMQAPINSSTSRREAVPRVPGHEAVGEVLVSRRSDVQPGERLVFSAIGSCAGDCANCSQHGHFLDCLKLVRYGQNCFMSSPGLSGCYATHLVVRPGTQIAQVPPSVPDLTALTATCRLAPLLWGVERALALTPANSTKCALVQGCGMRGILSCAVLLQEGFTVFCTDPDPSRLRIAQRFGAHPIFGAAENAEELLRSAPCGFQLAVRACGSRHELHAALAVLAHGGTYLLLGSACGGTGRGDEGALPLAAITAKALHIIGVPEYLPDCLQKAMTFLEATHAIFPYEVLFSPPFTFNDIQTALRLAKEKKFLRVTLKTFIN